MRLLSKLFHTQLCHHCRAPDSSYETKDILQVGKRAAQHLQTVKRALADAPVLAYFNKGAQTSVVTDTSPVGLAAVLIQEKDGISRAVCYTSCILSDMNGITAKQKRKH